MDNSVKKMGFAVVIVIIAILGCFMANEIILCRHYNKGNEYYQNSMYEEAIAEYEKALEQIPDRERACKIRINMALSMTKQIDIEKITGDSIDDVKEILKEAKSILMEKGCANDEGTGHNADAQQLKDDIDKFLESLENTQDSEADPKEKGESQEKSEEEEQLEQELKNIQSQSMCERKLEERLEEFLNDSDPVFNYDGERW